MIRVSHASVVRDGRPLVHDIDTTFVPGAVTAITGPNGAGKTTLLRLLTREMAPTIGRVEMDGRPLEAYSVTALARRRAVLPQSSHLSFPFTVLEVVRLAYSAGKPVSNTGDLLALETLAEVDLDGYGARPYQLLSGGEQQRVQLARVLCQLAAHSDAGRPQYLFLDEPTSNLDIRHQIDIFRLVRALAGRGVGVVAILHDLNLAAMFADRLIVMKDGAIAADGAPGNVLTDGLLEAVFALPLKVNRQPSDGTPYVLPHSAGPIS